MKKYLRYHIGLDKKSIIFGLILVMATLSMAQNTFDGTAIDSAEQGVRMIDVDLYMYIKPKYYIIYEDTPDTLFVYERQSDNSLTLLRKYVYDKEAKNWFWKDRPRLIISRNKDKTARMVTTKRDKKR